MLYMYLLLMIIFLFSSSGFTLVCEKDENRLIAENILDLLIRHLQEYCQVILQPSEVWQTRKTSVVTEGGVSCGTVITYKQRYDKQKKKKKNFCGNGNYLVMVITCINNNGYD